MRTACFIVGVAWTVVGAGAGCGKPSRPLAAPPVAVACPPAAPAAAPAPASAAALAELSPVSAEGADSMAMVVLMLPRAGGPNSPRGAHKYKLSLTTDADTATVEVDGQAMGAARVQHVPAGLEREGVAAAPARPSGAPLSPGATPEEAPLLPARNRATPTAMRPRPLLPASVALNPNGAPIID